MRFKNILGLSNEAAEIFDLRERSIMEYLTAYRAVQSKLLICNSSGC